VTFEAVSTALEWWTVGKPGPVFPQSSVINQSPFYTTRTSTNPSTGPDNSSPRRFSVKVRLGTSTTGDTSIKVVSQNRISVAQLYIPEFNHVREGSD
jgi:hypothetical protein